MLLGQREIGAPSRRSTKPPRRGTTTNDPVQVDRVVRGVDASGGNGTRLDGRTLADLRSPWSAEQRQEVAVQAVVAGDLPGEHQPDGHREEDRVARRRAREQEGHVHQRTEEGGDTDEGADEEPDADRGLTECDEPGEPRLMVALEEDVDEVAIPLEGDRPLRRVRI